jgi:iron complex transport system substrate-binding protein
MTMARLLRFAACTLAGLARLASGAPVSALDDEGRLIHLAAPARRIVSLAPHTTELLFAAGAGAAVVATVRHADFPEAARALPQVGDALALDLERIAALRPDLIVVWLHGSAAGQLARIRSLGVPVFHSEPQRLEQIGDSLHRLGVLAGTSTVADAAGAAFSAELVALRQRFAARPPMRVFFQVWNPPLMTLNKRHLIDEVIGLCGGVNVFADEPSLVPTVSQESVLAARPQVLVSTTPDGRDDGSLDLWRRYQRFEPVALPNRIVWLPADLITRQTPRVLQGARRLCESLEQARERGAAHRP